VNILIRTECNAIYQLGTVETAIRRAQLGQSFVGRSDFAADSASSSSAMHGVMRKVATPAKPAAKCASFKPTPKSEGRMMMDVEHDEEEPEYVSEEECEEYTLCDGIRPTRRSDTTGCPRVEHLSTAAVLCTTLKIDASGVISFKLPEDFFGASLVMLSSDSSCEWEVVHCFSSAHVAPPSLLQRQLCLTQPFTPDSHMALQVSWHCMSTGSLLTCAQTAFCQSSYIGRRNADSE
jgi:hypothetical protein